MVVALAIHWHIQADTQQIRALRRWLLLPFTCTSRPTPNRCCASPKVVALTFKIHLHIQADTQQICALRKWLLLSLIHLHIQADTQQICALRRWLLLPFTCTSRPTPNKFALSEGGCSYHSTCTSRPTPNKICAHPKVGALTIHLHIQADTQQIFALRTWLLLPFTCTSRPTPNKFALSEGGCSYHSLAHPGRHPTNLRFPKVAALTIHLHMQADTQQICALRRWFAITIHLHIKADLQTNLRSPKVVALIIHLHIQADCQQICALRRWLLLPFTCTSRPTPNKFTLSEGGCSCHSLAHPGRHPRNLRFSKVVALTINSLAHPGRLPTNLLLLPYTCISRPTPNKFALSESGCSYHPLAHPGQHPTKLRSTKVVALTIHLHI